MTAAATNAMVPQQSACPCRRRGFSLVEAVMASLIVGVLVVASLETVGAAVAARRSHAQMRQGDMLARQLLDEVVQARFADPGGGGTWGRDAAEAADSRETWDDVDDYHTFTETPPTLRDGTPVAGASGWTRGVTVERLRASDLSAVATHLDHGLKRITVVATSPGGVRTTLVALRADGGTHDAEMTSGTTQVTWAGLTLKLGEDGGAVAGGASLLNRPAP